MLLNYEHKFIYDFESLKRILEHAGFANVKIVVKKIPYTRNFSISKPISAILTGISHFLLRLKKFSLYSIKSLTSSLITLSSISFVMGLNINDLTNGYRFE